MGGGGRRGGRRGGGGQGRALSCPSVLNRPSWIRYQPTLDFRETRTSAEKVLVTREESRAFKIEEKEKKRKKGENEKERVCGIERILVKSRIFLIKTGLYFQ